MVPRLFRVDKRVDETPDTFTIGLSALDDGGSLAFMPGQFNMLYVFGKGESAISISGDPARAEELVHTIRAVGSVTKGAQALEVGASVGVRGPFGTPWPVEEAKGKDVLVIAGGIGLAPLRPVIYHVLKHRGDYQQATLLYGARTPRDMLYRSQLRRWRGRFDFEAHVTVDTARKDWHGHVGVVPALIPLANPDPTETVVMICGPEIMMRFTVRDLLDRGIPAQRIYISMERNMKCAVGHCGHCQLGPEFVCRDGPVFPWSHIQPLLAIREL
jgi:NAD(P)H-flavin reductase